MKTKSEAILTEASTEWSRRPDDERFLTLDDLEASVARRKKESWTAATQTNRLHAFPTSDEKGVAVELYDPSYGSSRLVEPTHFGFGQLSMFANTPAKYLRSLPAPLAAINIQWGLENNPVREDVLVLGQTNGSNVLRALTSQSYGRIWDIDVVKAVKKVNQSGKWVVPAASYAATNPKRATTLYASDRDVFIFLVDPEHPIEVNGEQLFRGFYTWNSEVGAATFGLTTFLYRHVCDNRIVWGATEVKELKIRHNGGAPERFAYEGAQYLNRYANEATFKTVETIKKANDFELPKSEKKDGWEGWLTSRGFTSGQAKNSVAAAQAEEGETRSLWNIINGVTAYARQIPHTDERVTVEKMAGKLLDRIANN